MTVEQSDDVPQPPPSEPPVKSPRSWLRWGKRVAQVAVFLLVLAGIGHTLNKASKDLGDFPVRELNPWWLTAAAGLYLLASVPSWLFWHQAMRAMGQQPGWLTSFRAFYIGHLGKYVPGKGMVVILRAGMVSGPQVDTTVAAASVFIETLTTMAMGAVISATYLAVRHRHEHWLLLGAALAVLAAGVPTLPPIFRRLVLLLRVQRICPKIGELMQGLNYPLMITGWITLACGWVLMGLSLWATLQSLPHPPEQLANLRLVLPQMTHCVAFAVVAGFVLMLPGGVGAREFVVMKFLAPDFGQVAAIVAAVLLRVVWLVAELIVSAILYFVSPQSVEHAKSP